jgi:hypothetical protein
MDDYFDSLATCVTWMIVGAIIISLPFLLLG